MAHAYHSTNDTPGDRKEPTVAMKDRRLIDAESRFAARVGLLFTVGAGELAPQLCACCSTPIERFAQAEIDEENDWS